MRTVVSATFKGVCGQNEEIFVTPFQAQRALKMKEEELSGSKTFMLVLSKEAPVPLTKLRINCFLLR